MSEPGELIPLYRPKAARKDAAVSGRFAGQLLLAQRTAGRGVTGFLLCSPFGCLPQQFLGLLLNLNFQMPKRLVPEACAGTLAQN